jgi:hypothetical protein
MIAVDQRPGAEDDHAEDAKALIGERAGSDLGEVDPVG